MSTILNLSVRPPRGSGFGGRAPRRQAGGAPRTSEPENRSIIPVRNLLGWLRLGWLKIAQLTYNCSKLPYISFRNIVHKLLR